MAKDLEAAAIRKLPWVASVVKNEASRWDDGHPGYVIKTKPGKLSVLVTHGIQLVGENIEDSYVGAPLEKPFKVPMGSLRMELRPSYGSVVIGMQTKPKKVIGKFLPYPAWDGSGLREENWNYGQNPCFGGYTGAYREADGWYAKAQLLAEFVQSAVPHRTENRGGALYAYALGLMPAEYIKVVESEDDIEDHYVPDGEEGDDDEGWGDDDW